LKCHLHLHIKEKSVKLSKDYFRDFEAIPDWHFIGGFATVKLGDKFGFIDKTGKEVAPLIYEEANNYHGNCYYKGMAHVKEKGKWKIIKLQE